MRRHLKTVLLLTLLLVATIPVAADSILQGDIEGLELCPQSLCGLAVFVGGFDGSVAGLPRQGAFLAGIKHDPDLPDEGGEVVAITGGVWTVRVPFKVIRGAILGGVLTSKGNNTFEVEMSLLVTSPGVALTTFTGTLRHDVFPPTIEGTIE